MINGLTRCFDEHIYIQKATEFHYLVSVFVIGIIIKYINNEYESAVDFRLFKKDDKESILKNR